MPKKNQNLFDAFEGGDGLMFSRPHSYGPSSISAKRGRARQYDDTVYQPFEKVPTTPKSRKRHVESPLSRTIKPTLDAQMKAKLVSLKVRMDNIAGYDYKSGDGILKLVSEQQLDSLQMRNLNILNLKLQDIIDDLSKLPTTSGVRFQMNRVGSACCAIRDRRGVILQRLTAQADARSAIRRKKETNTRSYYFNYMKGMQAYTLGLLLESLNAEQESLKTAAHFSGKEQDIYKLFLDIDCLESDMSNYLNNNQFDSFKKTDAERATAVKKLLQLGFAHRPTKLNSEMMLLDNRWEPNPLDRQGATRHSLIVLENSLNQKVEAFNSPANRKSTSVLYCRFMDNVKKVANSCFNLGGRVNVKSLIKNLNKSCPARAEASSVSYDNLTVLRRDFNPPLLNRRKVQAWGSNSKRPSNPRVFKTSIIDLKDNATTQNKRFSSPKNEGLTPKLPQPFLHRRSNSKNKPVSASRGNR